MRNLKMKAKIAASFAVVLATLIVFAVFSTALINRIHNDGQNLASHSIPSADALNQMRRSVEAIKGSTLEAMVVTDQKGLDNVVSELEGHRATLESAMATYLSLNPDSQESMDNMSKFIDDVAVYRKIIIDHCAKFSEAGKKSAYIIYANNYTSAFDRLVDCVMQLNEEVNDGIYNRYYDMEKSYKLAIIIVVAITALALAATVFLTIFLATAVTRPLRQIEAAMDCVSRGEFDKVSITYESKDELGILAENIRKTVSNLETLIGDMSYVCEEMGNGNFTVSSQNEDKYVGKYSTMLTSLRYLRNTLSETLSRIDQSAAQVLAGSQQVSDGAQNLSQGATEQASAIEELAATISELSDKVRTNAENAAIANKMSVEAGAGVIDSNNHMKELMAAMNEINDTASNIGKIIKTIEDIAFQTNILALNAAVEAARAGEAGKGFAVVADEVRNLAGKSAEAANNTTALIESTIRAVRSGSEQATSTAASLEAVVKKASGVADIIGEISEASEQQATAINQIGTGIDQISAVVQTNSATAEQSAAASEELSGQADMLKELISQFTLSDEPSSFSESSFEAPSASSFTPDNFDFGENDIPAPAAEPERENADNYSPFTVDFDAVDDKY